MKFFRNIFRDREFGGRDVKVISTLISIANSVVLCELQFHWFHCAGCAWNIIYGSSSRVHQNDQLSNFCNMWNLRYVDAVWSHHCILFRYMLSELYLFLTITSFFRWSWCASWNQTWNMCNLQGFRICKFFFQQAHFFYPFNSTSELIWKFISIIDRCSCKLGPLGCNPHAQNVVVLGRLWR